MALGFDRSHTLYLAELASAFFLSPLVSSVSYHRVTGLPCLCRTSD